MDLRTQFVRAKSWVRSMRLKIHSRFTQDPRARSHAHAHTLRLVLMRAQIPQGNGKGLEFSFSAVVVGVVPLGGGVSSSASLSVAMATFLQGILSSAGISPPSSKVQKKAEEDHAD